MLTDKLAPDKTDKTMTCIMAWLLLTFGNICRGFLKKKLTTGKQVTKTLLKNTQQKSDIKPQQFSEIFSELAQNPKDGTDNP